MKHPEIQKKINKNKQKWGKKKFSGVNKLKKKILGF